MKIISWNVAGFRACLKKGFEVFFDSIDADIVCLQEVKAMEDQFDYRPDGYEMYLNPAERKGYSGTLVFSRVKPIVYKYEMGINGHDGEGRLITMEFKDFYLINTYVPNVKGDLSRLDERMLWEENFLIYVKNLEKNKPVVICGDFNVAHNEIDIANVKSNIGRAGFTYEEREKFSVLLNNGFIDTFRYLYPDVTKYSYWDYFTKARDRNVGWRIDYFLVSNNILNKVSDAYIYNDVYGSDHCPIGLDIKFEVNND